MNKKSSFLAMLAMVLAFGLVLVGCASAPISHQNATAQNGATLFLNGGGAAIRQFDGEIPSNWVAPNRLYNTGSLKVIVPAGRHKFLITGLQGQQEIDQVLEAGHTYEIKSSLTSNVTFTDITK